MCILQLNYSADLQNRNFWIQFSKVKRQMNVLANPFSIVVRTTLNANNTRVVLISWNSNVEISLYWATHYNGTISKQFLQKEEEMRLIRLHCPGTATSVRRSCGRRKVSIRSTFRDDGALIQEMTFWTLSIVLFLFRTMFLNLDPVAERSF